MYVIINGVSSETLQGVQILSLPPITKPRMRTSIATIDGRPGDIVTRLGYEAYNRKIEVLLHHNYDVYAVTAFFNQSGTIIFSNEPDMVYQFETIDAFDFERAVRFRTGTVTFHVQPYKTSASEQPFEAESESFMDSEPYLFRASGDATMQIDELVGGSVVWNQLCDVPLTSSTGSGITYTKNADGSVSFSGTASSLYTRRLCSYFDVTDHTYIVLFNGKTDSNILLAIYANRAITSKVTTSQAYSIVKTDNTWDDFSVFARINNGTTANDTFYPQIFDLTLMFGSTIADYIYTQEQATAGAGVAFFRSLFNKPYYAYNAGEIKSVTGLTSHKMTGFNQWDEEWEVGGLTNAAGAPYNATDRIRSKNFCDALPNASYYLKAPNEYIAIYWYDANKTFIRANFSATVTSPDNARFFKITLAGNTTTYNGDICINLSDPAKNGTYEPYESHSYALDSTLTLRGIPKLDANNNLYYDGDEYEADGTVERRYGVVDMGTLRWSYNSTSAYFYGDVGGKALGNWNIRCSTYSLSSAQFTAGMQDKEIKGNASSNSVFVKDSAYTDAVTFKTAMNGVYLVYELATSTTETADPFTNPQVVYPGGTEGYIDERTIPVPVGHNTKYLVPIEMTVTNSGNTDSAPSLTIEGSGAIEVAVDGLIAFEISMPSTGTIVIDSAAMDAMDGDGNLANRSVSGDYSNLRLTPGEHTIIISGDAASVSLQNVSRWI